MIVVGSGNSSNSVRLVEVALEAGARAAYRVDDAGEIDEAWLDGRGHGQRHLRRLGARGAGAGRAGLPGRARLPRCHGRAQRRGEPDLRPARPSCAATCAPPQQGLTGMARYLDVHPDNPQPRLIDQVVRGAARRRCADRLPDRLGLRPGLPDRQPRRPRPDPADPRPRRAAPLHAGLQGLLPARSVRARRQRGVPGDQGRDAGALHVHPPGHPRGAAPADAPEEAHGRGAHPRPHRGPGAARRSSASRCCPAR